MPRARNGWKPKLEPRWLRMAPHQGSVSSGSLPLIRTTTLPDTSSATIFTFYRYPRAILGLSAVLHAREARSRLRRHCGACISDAGVATHRRRATAPTLPECAGIPPPQEVRARRPAHGLPVRAACRRRELASRGSCPTKAFPKGPGCDGGPRRLKSPRGPSTGLRALLSTQPLRRLSSNRGLHPSCPSRLRRRGGRWSHDGYA